MQCRQSIIRIEAENTSLEAQESGVKKRLRQRIKELENQYAAAMRDHQQLENSLKEERNKSQERLQNAQLGLQAIDQNQNELLKLKAALGELTSVQTQQKASLIRNQRQIDSLKQANARYAHHQRQLYGTIDSLQRSMEVLDPHAQDVSTRRRVYMKQLENLNRLERRLPLIEQELYAREKRIAQRENTSRPMTAHIACPLYWIALLN